MQAARSLPMQCRTISGGGFVGWILVFVGLFIHGDYFMLPAKGMTA